MYVCRILVQAKYIQTAMIVILEKKYYVGNYVEKQDYEGNYCQKTRLW